MKYTTDYLVPCIGYSVGSYSHYTNKHYCQILQEGKILKPEELYSTLQNLEERLLNTLDDLMDADRKLKLATLNEDLLQEEIRSLRKQLRNNKSELTSSGANLTRSIASHYETEAKLKALQ